MSVRGRGQRTLMLLGEDCLTGVRIQLGFCRLTNMSVATPKRVDQDSTGASKYATLLISKVE